MVTFISIGLWALLLPQDDPSRQTRELIEKLRSDRIEDREEAARAIKALGRASLQELEKAAADKDPEVAQWALKLVRTLAITEKLTPHLMKIMPGLEDRLTLEDPGAWAKALLDAGNLKDVTTRDLEVLAPLAVRGATDGWSRSLEPTRTSIFSLIDERSLRAAVPEIVRLLKRPEQTLRFRSIELLGELESTECVPDLIDCLMDKEGGVREQAVKALGKLGTPPGISCLLGVMRGRLPDEIRAEAIMALGRLGAPEAIPEIVALLDSKSPTIRKASVQALQDSVADDVGPRLLPHLKDPDPEVRRSTAMALGEIRAKEAIPDLENLLGGKDLPLIGAALMALERLGAHGSIPAIVRLLTLEGPETEWTRGYAVVALAALEAREEIPRMIRLLEDTSPYPRGRAVRALAELGAKDQLPQISALLSDPDWIVQNEVLRAFVALDAREKIPDIVTMLTGKQAYMAVSALASLGAREKIPDIARLVEDPSVIVRLAVVNGLCTLGSREGVPALLRECADLRWPIREGQSNISIGKSPAILNALRQPDLWKRLRGTAVAPDVKSTRKANIERIAKDAGLALDWYPSVKPDLDGWISSRRLRPQGMKSWTFLDELGHVLYGRWGGSRSSRYEAVLEPDRIRIMTYDEALQFWIGWWKAEQEKK